MFNMFIGVVASIAINLFGSAYSVGVDTCADVYYNPDADCMVSVFVHPAYCKTSCNLVSYRQSIKANNKTEF